jgi:hypothetical protein
LDRRGLDFSDFEKVRQRPHKDVKAAMRFEISVDERDDLITPSEA